MAPWPPSAVSSAAVAWLAFKLRRRDALEIRGFSPGLVLMSLMGFGDIGTSC